MVARARISSLRRNRASRLNSGTSTSRSAAYTTNAPSAAIGNFASTPPPATSTRSTNTSVTNEYSCVRLPSASPSAVRLPLSSPETRAADRFRRCRRPAPAAPRLHPLAGHGGPQRCGPSARCRRMRRSRCPPPGSTARKSATPTPGKPGVGNPLGISPITRIPLRSNENIETAAVASSIAIRGPGSRGTNRASASSTTSTAADKAIVGQCTPSSPLMNDRTWSTNSSPSTDIPVTLPSWLPIMITATPVM